MFEFFALFGITLLAYFAKGITGFGNTLIINSLFSFFKENKFITPFDLVLSLPTNLYLAWKERKNIDYKLVGILSTFIIIGDIPGVIFLTHGEDNTLKVILGFF